MLLNKILWLVLLEGTQALERDRIWNSSSAASSCVIFRSSLHYSVHQFYILNTGLTLVPASRQQCDVLMKQSVGKCLTWLGARSRFSGNVDSLNPALYIGQNRIEMAGVRAPGKEGGGAQVTDLSQRPLFTT